MLFPPPPTPPPSHLQSDTQLPFDILFITMFYMCLVTEVMYHRGEQHRIRKKLKSLYILVKGIVTNCCAHEQNTIRDFTVMHNLFKLDIHLHHDDRMHPIGFRSQRSRS